jgi:hypothetical protein
MWRPIIMRGTFIKYWMASGFSRKSMRMTMTDYRFIRAAKARGIFP